MIDEHHLSEKKALPLEKGERLARSDEQFYAAVTNTRFSRESISHGDHRWPISHRLLWWSWSFGSFAAREYFGAERVRSGDSAPPLDFLDICQRLPYFFRIVLAAARFKSL